MQHISSRINLPTDFTTDKSILKKFGNYLPSIYRDQHRSWREQLLLEAMGRHYTDKIDEKIDFEDIKRKCVEKLKNTPPNVDYIKAEQYIKSVNRTLETYGKLKYCTRDLSINKYSTESVYLLYIIYLKLSKRGFESIHQSKEFQFLLQIIRSTNIKMFEVPKYPLSTLCTILFEQITSDNFEFDPNAIFEEVEQEKFEQLLEECNITPEELETMRDEYTDIIITNKYFEYWLKDELKTVHNWDYREDKNL